MTRKITELVYMDLDKLKKHPNNPRTIKNDSFKKLMTSIDENPDFFEARPIMVSDRTGELIIIGGNQRYAAAKELGFKQAPVIVLPALTEEKEKEIMIRDNIANGEWDYDKLANEWDAGQLNEWGLDVPDWDKETANAGLTDPDDVPEPEENPVTVQGDLWVLGDHRLLCGDSTNKPTVERLMNGQKADMVFTDPPYGVSYEGGHNVKKRQQIKNDYLKGESITDLFYKSLSMAILFTHSHAAFYIWYASGKSVETFASLSVLPLDLRAVIQWYKVKSGLGAFMSQYIPNCEPCIYAFKRGESPQWFGPTDEKTVWELKKEQKNDFHPTQKPVELPERALNNSSKTGQVILDLFLGSGSTLIACEKTSRQCFGMELDPKYCDVIIKRWQDFSGKIAVLESTGQTFEEVKAQRHG